MSKKSELISLLNQKGASFLKQIVNIEGVKVKIWHPKDSVDQIKLYSYLKRDSKSISTATSNLMKKFKGKIKLTIEDEVVISVFSDGKEMAQLLTGIKTANGDKKNGKSKEAN